MRDSSANPYATCTDLAKARRHLRGGDIHSPACGQSETHPDTGLTWEDMPGSGEVRKRIHFFFHRRGFSVADIVEGKLWDLPELAW